MTSSDRRLAASMLRSILTALLASGGKGTGQSGAELYRLSGALSASASETVASGAFASDLKDCFDAARVSGATFAGMQQVQVVVQSVSTANGAVQRVAQTALRFSLVQMALILAATTFTSRADVDAALQAVNAAFEPAEDYAANQRNNVVFRALVALHASVVRDLTRRGRPLPSIVPFNLGQSLPALTISNRLYGVGDRAVELIAENKCIHPLFMKGAGKALAV